MHELNQKPSIPTSQILGKSHGSKMMLFVFGGVILLVGIGSYVLGTKKTQVPTVNNAFPQPSVSPTDETANWKTYINPTYKFSIEYPSTLRVSSNGDFAADLVDSTINQASITTKDIKVRISVNQTARNFDKIYAAQNNSIIAEEQHALDAKFTKINNSMTDGYKTVSYTYDVPGNQTEKSFTTGIIINKNGILIELSTWETDTTVFDQILSTFKFANENVSQVINGVGLKDIRYTLPQGWMAEITKDGLGEEGLSIKPNGGGYFSIKAYNYTGSLGRREYYCQVRKVLTLPQFGNFWFGKV